MGSRLSKPSNSQQASEQPHLYAVATPHPTLQYIYPVYAAPVDVSNPSDRGKPERTSTKGRNSPLAWRSEKKRNREELQVVEDHEDFAVIAQPPVAANSADEYGINEDGTWYHFHVDSAGAVDYIRPGTTLPSAFSVEPTYTPQVDGGLESITMTPSQSTAGVPQEELYHSYPASPYHGQQGYHQPQPQRVQPDYSTAGSYHQVYYSPHPRPYNPRSYEGYSSHDSYAYAHGHPRARSVSPVHSRSFTPSGFKPRRATTPTPRGSRVQNYDPPPPVPQHITPLSTSSRRSVAPFPKGRSAPIRSPRMPTDGDDYILEPREREREHKIVAFATRNGRTSRNGRRPSADRPSADEDSTAISSAEQPEASLISSKAYIRPHSPTPASDASHAVRIGYRDRERERIRNKHMGHYPSPSTDASQPRGVVEDYAS